jgi:hypothetical protein
MKRRLNNKHTRQTSCFDYIHKFATDSQKAHHSISSKRTDSNSPVHFYVRFQIKTLVIHNPAFREMSTCSLVGVTNVQSVRMKTVYSSQMSVAANYQTTRFRNQKVQKIFQHVTDRQPASVASKYLRGL